MLHNLGVECRNSIVLGRQLAIYGPLGGSMLAIYGPLGGTVLAIHGGLGSGSD